MRAAIRSVARALAPAAVVIALLVGPGVAHAAPNPWTAMGSFVAGERSGESLVKLHDGSVLAIGGSNLSSVERYDPATGTWAAVAPMSTARADAVAVALADGTVLVAGGHSGGIPTSSAERYDPTTDRWAPAGAMAQARRSAMGSALLPDGTVLVAGGIVDMFGTYTASAERYDPATDSWSSAGSLSAARGFGTLTLLPDGGALAVGGSGSDLSAVADRYDPATDSWTPVAPLPAPTYFHTATGLADGRVLVAGGATAAGRTTSVQAYDLQADRWTAVGSMGRPRSAAAAVRLPNGAVLLVGGNGEDDSAELFDPATDRWLPAGHVGAVLFGSKGVALNDGSALVVGGGPFGDTAAWRFSLITAAVAVPLDFGEQVTGRQGPVLALTVRNDGDAPLYVAGAAIQGPDAGDFSVAYDQCAQGPVTPGGSCLVGVRFVPSALGARSATLVLTGDVPNGTTSAALGGVGIAPIGAGSGSSGGGGTPAAALVRGVRCSARSGRAVTCSGLPARLTAMRGAVVLKRGRLTFARGTLRGETLTLNVTRRLFHARYRLVVGRGAHARTTSIVIR